MKSFIKKQGRFVGGLICMSSIFIILLDYKYIGLSLATIGLIFVVSSERLKLQH